jgi:lysophospholipid acyltransferase (LPLAT)-like uncharacterized protein
VLILWGNPIHIEAKTSREALEEKKRELENTLNHLTEQADILACGK